MRCFLNMLFCALLAVLVQRCTTLTPLAGTGSGSETTNGYVVGSLVYSDGSKASMVQVTLIPGNYDPVRDSILPASFSDTTDLSGSYRLKTPDTGVYTIQAVHLNSRTRVLITGIVVQRDTVHVKTDTLRNIGQIKVMPLDSADALFGYLYIPGTTVFALLNNSSGFVMLDSVPAGVMPAIALSSTNNAASPIIRYDVPVVSGGTTTVWNPSWKHARQLCLNTSPAGANVSNDVYNFPVLVRLTRGTFSFSQAKAGGEDLRFTKADNTALTCAIERWDSAAQVAEIWVKVDTVFGNSSARYIVMYWGNASAGASSDGAAVFDTANGFKAVLHFNGNCGDATKAHNDGTGYGVTDTAGVIGKAGRFHGSDSVRIAGLFDSLQNLTISAWAELDTADVKGSEVISIGDVVVLRMDDVGGTVDGYGTRGSFRSDSALRVVSSGQYFAETGWHHIAYTVDRTRSFQSLYLDGTRCCFTNFIEPIGYSGWGSNAVIGKHGKVATGYGFKGVIDEVQISRVPRSADWLKLCFMNQRADDKLIMVR